MNTGIVTRIESKDYYVLFKGEEVRCSLRGKLKLEAEWKKDKFLYTDLVAVGDRVQFSFNEDGTGVIEELPERKNYLSRKAPKVKGISEKGRRFEQIIASNVDFTCCVTSILQPVFNNRVLDRMIVTAESCQTEPIIIINKVDLDKKHKSQKWFDLYESLGYKTFLCSATNNIGTDELKELMNGKTTVFIGHSGVGKSSLINSIDPEISQAVNEISEAWDKGVHTTVTAVLFQVAEDTFVIDTPGIREIEPFGITKEDITHYFKEISQYSSNCKFNTCTHIHEPNCAVKKALEQGLISEERYDSYLRLVESLEEDEY